MQTLMGHSSFVLSSEFSPDGKKVVTSSADHTGKIWKSAGGKLEHTLAGHSFQVNSAQFSLNGKLVYTVSHDGDAIIWESGKLKHKLKGHKQGVISANFSSDNLKLVTASFDETAKVWDVNTGQLLQSLVGHRGRLTLAQFSGDGRYIATASIDATARIWDAQLGKLAYSLEGHSNTIESVQFSLDSKYLVTSSCDKTARVWEVNSGILISILEGHSHIVGPSRFSPDGKSIFASFGNNSAKILETNSGKVMSSIANLKDNITTVEYSPDGKFVFTSFGINQYSKIWATATFHLAGVFKPDHQTDNQWGKFSQDSKDIATFSSGSSVNVWASDPWRLKNTLQGHEAGIRSVEFSQDGHYLLTSSWDNKAKIWNTTVNGQVRTLYGHAGVVNSASFSPNEKYIVTASEDGTAKLWDFNEGKSFQNTEGYSSAKDWFKNKPFGPPTKTLIGHTKAVSTAQFSPNGKYVLTTSKDTTSKIWEVETGAMLHSLNGHKDEIYISQFSPDSEFVLTSSNDFTTKIWTVANGKPIKELRNSGKLTAINNTWNRILFTEDYKLSIFDVESLTEIVSMVSIDSVDWVVTHSSGLFDASPGAMNKLYFTHGLDIINFNQLKERYYEPGLWKKAIAGDDIRNVMEFNSIELPPDIQVGLVDDKGYLNINLTNRGGGIGEVNLYLNGKEIVRDAREGKINPDAPSASLKIFVAKHKSIIKGQENLLTVKGWNKNHWVVSRGQIVSYHSKEIEQYRPAVYILTCGVSDYKGNEIDLKYAAKDANDVSVALQLGAKKLFGVDRSFVYNLTTSQEKEFYPTKINILKALDKISSSAHPLDVFVMYLSGHGINYGGQDGDWYYLTQEAYTGNSSAYNDPAIRTQTAFSSDELVDLFKKVPALKQVLILDACASGKVVDNLMEQKDIESTTLRALDRMRDRTGMHIITGCTADAVSYEASKYGQGVLTYSLLEGIRGAALRENQYVDINKLFQYAQDRVPQLAEGIGGIQSPQIFSPQGSQSFDIGLLSDEEKREIPIAKIRPVFVRSNFIDENAMEDALGLSKVMDDALNEASTKGILSSLIFVDVREYPEGCKLSGLYRKEGDIIVLKLKKRCGMEDVTFLIKSSNINELKMEILNLLKIN